MTKRKPSGDSLTQEEQKFVNQANSGGQSKAPYQLSAREPREHEGFLMLVELRQRMTEFSWRRKNARKHPWTKQDIYNIAIREFLDRNGG